MKLLLLGLVTFSLNIFANPCVQMMDDYLISCQAKREGCNNLGSCKNLRNKCNSNINTHDGCSNFMSCVTEEFTGKPDSRSCIYQWSGQPNEQNKCENMNYASIHIIAHSCPGYSVFADKFPDKDFNCTGHQKRYEESAKKCDEARENLKRYCNKTVAEVPACEHKDTRVVIQEEAANSPEPHISTLQRWGGVTSNVVYEFKGMFQEWNSKDSTSDAVSQ